MEKHEAEKLLEAQKAYFDTNATRSLKFRTEQLKKLKKAIKNHEKQLLKAMEKDLGKNAHEAYMTEVGFLYSSISHTIKNLPKWMKNEKKKTPLYMFPSRSYVKNEPYGSVLILGAYNYPLQLVMEPLIGAMAAGNTAVVKTPEGAPNTATEVKNMMDEAFDEKYVACVNGDAYAAANLVEAGFDYIFFTGSAATGSKIMEAAAKKLTPVTLELGGKSPVIVDRTANLKEAARRIAWGKYLNAGQTCVAPDYVLADKEVMENLICHMQKMIRKYYGKNPQKSRDFGRIANDREFGKLAEMISEAKEMVVTGGVLEASEKYVSPTIIKFEDMETAVKYKVMQEEIFGPVLPVIPFGDIRQAQEFIKKGEKPLALYIFSKNRKLQKEIIENISSGNTCINDTIMHIANPFLPFGGVGKSGIGAYHGHYSFKTFSHAKGVVKKPSGIGNPLILPPYSKRKGALVKKFLK
ncbi:MAG: aldehyde dehydrogenase family protein [Anaerovoracaceae bacterium]